MKIIIFCGTTIIFLLINTSPLFAQWCNINGQVVEGFTRSECEARGDWLTAPPPENGNFGGGGFTTGGGFGGGGFTTGGNLEEKSIGDLIKFYYTYAIGIVGILATVVIMIGGLIWISSMGNAARVGEAKAWIGAALTGLLLAMTSYTLLYIINPNLVKFEKIGLPEIDDTLISEESRESGGPGRSSSNYSCHWEQVTGGRSCSDTLGYNWKNAGNASCSGDKGYLYLCCCITQPH